MRLLTQPPTAVADADHQLTLINGPWGTIIGVEDLTTGQVVDGVLTEHLTFAGWWTDPRYDEVCRPLVTRLIGP